MVGEMRTTRMIFPERFFAIAWQSEEIRVVDIARIYGTSRAAIYRAANRFNLDRRSPPQEPEHEPEPRPTTYREELLWSRGRWSVLCEMAERYGKTLTQVQADFHRARAHEE